MSNIGDKNQGPGDPAVLQKALAKKRSTEVAKATEVWLCLRFTQLALNSAGYLHDEKQVAAITYQQQIWQCTEPARQLAITPGMTVNHALMLCPDIHLQERAPQKEASKLLKLSHWAYRFTSLVSAYNEHAILLEIGKSIKLFKGLEHLLNLINNDLSSFGVNADSGLADTPKASYLLSFTQQDSAPLSTKKALLDTAIEHLDIDHETISKLHDCGFQILADLAPIPNHELGVRFGDDFLRYLKQLKGDLADPQIGTSPPETFQASADFSEPIRNVSWIQQQLDRLLNDLNQFITLRQLVCRSFIWRFYHENNQLLETVSIGLSSSQNTLTTFRELTDLKLASLALKWEFSSIELTSTQLIPIQLFCDDLFDPSPQQEQFNQLIDKLINRLGQNALFNISSEPEHLPELANGRQHAYAKETGAIYQTTDSVQSIEGFKDEPLWLLEHPKRLSQQAQQPVLEGPLTIIHGPNRVTSHWWAKLQSRDYFIARQRNGRLLWLYFDRGCRQWYLHGLFA